MSGLDPAQPGFNMSDPNDTLGPEDAQFVGELILVCFGDRFVLFCCKLSEL